MLENSEQQPKKPYVTPKLTVHGDVAKMTENVGVVAGDGQIGSQYDWA